MIRVKGMTRRLSPLLAGAVALALCQVAFEQPSQLAATSARVIECYGDVQTRHSAGGYKAAKVGETLVPTDGIKTGANSRAQLAVGSNQYVRMDQNTQLLITQVQQSGVTTLQTIIGGVWVTIQKAVGAPTKFDVQTPSVTAGARGTIFRCDVQEDGGTDVYVYEGEVDVTGEGGGEPVRVMPDRFARARRGAGLAVADINLDEDERHDFVRYNRHCETLMGVGNPKVLVALSVVEDARPQAAIATSDRLVQALRQLGYIAVPIKPDQLRDATFDNQGALKVKPKLADYYLVGAIRVQAPRAVPGRPTAGTATIRARLVAADDSHVVSTAQAERKFTVPPKKPFGLPNGQSQQAIHKALEAIGDDVARQMAPQLMADIVVDRPSAIRVDVAAGGDPRQIRALKDLLAEAMARGRVTPLPRFDGGISFLLTGEMQPADLARELQARGGAFLQSAQAQGRVVRVSFRPGAAPPQ